VRIYIQLVYGMCISSDYSVEECELSADEVEQFLNSAQEAQAAGTDVSAIRPPLSNPYRAIEYAEGGDY
jgi:hypothetical protein